MIQPFRDAVYNLQNVLIGIHNSSRLETTPKMFIYSAVDKLHIIYSGVLFSSENEQSVNNMNES